MNTVSRLQIYRGTDRYTKLDDICKYIHGELSNARTAQNDTKMGYGDIVLSTY
jgi:hypothetical protein